MWPSATNPADSRPSRMPELARTRARLEQGLGDNLWTGYSLAVRKKNRLLGLAGGDVSDINLSVPWFSAGKPVTAAGVLRVLERLPRLWPEPLSATFPDLAGTHAGTLTLEKILTHQTGLRIPEKNIPNDPAAAWEYFRRITPADAGLSQEQAAYDPAGGWWLLGQWLQRHTDRPWQEFLEQDLLAPAGIAGLKFRPPAVPIRERRAGKWLVGEPGVGPGAGLSGPAPDLVLFYEKLLHERLLAPSSLQAMRRAARTGKADATFGHMVDFGLGVILNSNRYGADTVPYGFGTQAGAGAFGHGGARSSIAFADPEAGFTAAVFLNGRVPETEHQPRMRILLDLLRSELA